MVQNKWHSFFEVKPPYTKNCAIYFGPPCTITTTKFIKAARRQLEGLYVLPLNCFGQTISNLRDAPASTPSGYQWLGPKCCTKNSPRHFTYPFSNITGGFKKCEIRPRFSTPSHIWNTLVSKHSNT